MVNKIYFNSEVNTVKSDIERYIQSAINNGANDAKMIETDSILIDERVRAKCYIPLCEGVGKSLNCPPYTMDLDTFQKVVNRYNFAVFYMIMVPSEELCGIDFIAKKKGAPSAIKNYQICSKLESLAFYDGYYFAMGFAGGPCGPYFCGNQECAALESNGCRHPLKARPSMEAMGINAFEMAFKVGWEIYPVGKCLQPEDVPHGIKLGLVLIH